MFSNCWFLPTAVAIFKAISNVKGSNLAQAIFKLLNLKVSSKRERQQSELEIFGCSHPIFMVIVIAPAVNSSCHKKFAIHALVLINVTEYNFRKKVKIDYALKNTFCYCSLLSATSRA